VGFLGTSRQYRDNTALALGGRETDPDISSPNSTGAHPEFLIGGGGADPEAINNLYFIL
jgi:hypothetical protein